MELEIAVSNKEITSPTPNILVKLIVKIAQGIMY